VEVLPGERHSRRVVVVVLVEVRVEELVMGQPVEEMEGHIFAEHQENEGA
jgi:hypothetical protein